MKVDDPEYVRWPDSLVDLRDIPESSRDLLVNTGLLSFPNSYFRFSATDSVTDGGDLIIGERHTASVYMASVFIEDGSGRVYEEGDERTFINSCVERLGDFLSLFEVITRDPHVANAENIEYIQQQVLDL